jgi:hypothetical protein
MKLERERERGFELKKRWLKVFASKLSGQPSRGDVRGPLIAPGRNLPVRVSETRTCPSWRPDMSGNRL